ncbi:MAG TPA: redoxin domain-containing protein [Phycisphaerales bacterium]|nr:redoxin domain-containing protein [Phycisphaerales bacterium]
MALRQGDKAFPFKLSPKIGQDVDLGGHIGKENVVLLFIPFAFSPTCTAEVCHFRDHWRKFASLNAKVFAISVDSPFVTDKFRAAESIPYPVLSDFNKEVSRRYGVLHEDLMGYRGVSKRAVFVIGKDGIIKYSWVTEDPRNQIKFDEVEAALSS